MYAFVVPSAITAASTAVAFAAQVPSNGVSSEVTATRFAESFP